MARTPGTKTREQMLQMGYNTMTPEQVHEYQSLGGKVSAARKRRKKLMREIANDILNMKLQSEEEIKAALKEGGLEDQDINYAAGILMVQTLKAMGGDTKAAEFVRDTSGQKPETGLLVGNLDDKPFETIDFSALTDEQLRDLIEAKTKEAEEE